MKAAEAAILNAAKTPPFYINDDSEPGEVVRLKYRYLDLRRERMHRNLVTRHRVVKYIRDFLTDRALPRGRDAGAGQPDAGGRARLPGAQPHPSAATSTRCRSRRSSSSSC